MKVGVFDIAAVALAIYLAAPAQAQTAQPPVTAIRPHLPASSLVRGVIEGSLGYPGEFVPPLKVCAENLSTQTQFCTGVVLEDTKYQHGVGYKLAVPPGRYRVFASDTEKIAYFSQAVPCGLKVSCQDHKPVTVVVTAGQEIAGVDPIDWYTPSGYGLPVD